MNIKLDSKEISWMAEALSDDGKSNNLYRYFEVLLANPHTPELAKKCCLEYFMNFARVTGFGFHRNLRTRMAMKTIAIAIRYSKNINDPLKSVYVEYFNILAKTLNRQPITKYSSLSEYLAWEFNEEVQEILKYPKSNWDKQEACLNYFLAQSHKNQKKSLYYLENIVQDVMIDNGLLSRILETIKLIKSQ